MKGSLTLIVGPMFSGKTTELIRLSVRYQLARKKVLVINHCLDNRYDSEENFIVSHQKIKLSAVHLSSLEKGLSCEQLEQCDVIAIDEAQFFPDLFVFCRKWAQRKTLVVAGLDATAEAKPFGQVCELLAISEKVEKLSAICSNCNEDAAFTLKKTQNQQEIEIGGADLYEPACRTCFYKKTQTD